MRIGSNKNFASTITSAQVLSETSFYGLAFSFEILETRRANSMLLVYPSTAQLLDLKQRNFQMASMLSWMKFGFVGRIARYRLLRNRFDLRNSFNKYQMNGLAIPNCYLGNDSITLKYFNC